MQENDAHKTQLIQITGSTWRIRPADATDAEQLFTYLQAIAHEPFNNTRFRDGIMVNTVDALRDEITLLRALPNATIFVLEINHQIAGTVFCHNGAHVMNQHSVHLSINVHEYYRGMGFGTQLMSAAIQWATIQPDIRRVELEVLARNQKAIGLYEKLGFQREGTLIQAYQLLDEPEQAFVDSVLMALRV